MISYDYVTATVVKIAPHCDISVTYTWSSQN